MAHHDAHHPVTVSNGLHPAIYLGLAGFSLWLVVSAWVFFGSFGQHVAYLVAIVTGFFLMAGAIPFAIWHTWRRRTPDGAADRSVSFSEWWHGEMETWQGRVEGWDAAVEVLMPLGTAAIGMTLIGLIFRLTAG